MTAGWRADDLAALQQPSACPLLCMCGYAVCSAVADDGVKGEQDRPRAYVNWPFTDALQVSRLSAPAESGRLLTVISAPRVCYLRWRPVPPQ